jgi:membrane dipeptidase
VGGDAEVLCPFGLDRAYEGALALLEAMEADVAESAGTLQIARTAADVRRLRADGTFSVILGLEGAMPVGADLGRLAEFHDRGIRLVGLTWNSKNDLATGLGCGTGGLTPTGAEAIAHMNALGLIVDLAHASPRTYSDVMEVTTAPVAVSHANARAVWEHRRNLADDQLARLRENGGVCGAVLYGDFIAAGTITVEHLLDHIAHLLGILGEGGVAIGADFIDYFSPQALADTVPGGGAPPFPVGIEDTATLDSVLDGLAGRGYGPDVIDGVAAENFLRLFAAVEAAGGSEASGTTPRAELP